MASIALRSGLLGVRLANHLLRRATYYVTPDRIKQLSNMTANDAVDELFQKSNLIFPDGPLSWETGNPIFDLADHAGAETLILSSGQVLNANALWRIYECIYDQSATWKIVNWFGSIYSVGASTRYNYHFWRLLYSQTHTNLKTLANKVTLSANMMLYLSNHYNSKGSNENYAREFLELFTILKGEAIGVDNYTNYTEGDITLAAKVLSGFRIKQRDVDSDTGIPRSMPDLTRHDVSEKVFSDAFQDQSKPNIHIITGATVANDMDRELSDFIEMIFNQLETARAYVRKMYRYFVSDIIDAEVESDVIEPLAIQLKGTNNEYNHIDVLKTLLKSQHFYDEDDTNTENEILGGKIKSPFELLYQSVGLLKIALPDANNNTKLFKNNFTAIAHEHLTYIGLDMRGPSTVEGYPGFYDSPSFSKNWFTSNYLYRRFTFGVSFRRGLVRNTTRYFPFSVDVVSYIKDNFDDPAGPGTPAAPLGVANATLLVTELLSYFLPEMPTGERYSYFETTLLGGLSPTNWYFSWAEYLDPNNDDDQNVRVGLENLYNAIFSSPEFQTF